MSDPTPLSNDDPVQTIGVSPKVVNGGIAGAVVLVLSFILHLVGVDLPPEVASALTTIAAVVVAYFSKPGEVV